MSNIVRVEDILGYIYLNLMAHKSFIIMSGDILTNDPDPEFGFIIFAKPAEDGDTNTEKLVRELGEDIEETPIFSVAGFTIESFVFYPHSEEISEWSLEEAERIISEILT